MFHGSCLLTLLLCFVVQVIFLMSYLFMLSRISAAKDCQDVYKSGVRKSGIYPITTTSQSMLIYCDLSTANTGWIVIQRKVDATTSFDRMWTDYKRGFGNITHNYWMGLDNIHQLAGPGRGATLRLDLKDEYSRSKVVISGIFICTLHTLNWLSRCLSTHTGQPSALLKFSSDGN